VHFHWLKTNLATAANPVKPQIVLDRSSGAAPFALKGAGFFLKVL
jgi:hypothetical protein